MRWGACGVVAVVAVATRMPAPAVAMPADHPCIGPWEGVGKNTWESEPWTIALTLTEAPSGTQCGTIEYPSLGCGGTLERCEVVNGDIVTREVYTHGFDACAPPATVIIHCEHERMRYTWDGPEDHVETMLHRPDGYRPPRPPAKPDAAPAPAGPASQGTKKKGCACSAGGGAGASVILLVALAILRSRCCAWRAARARGTRAGADRSGRPGAASRPARGRAPSARSRRRSARRCGR